MSDAQIHVQTPAIFSSPLSAKLGHGVFLKLENCQPTGSFKLRGIGALCAEAAKRGVTRLVSSSGGNAGLAAAYSGKRLGLLTTVFVPETTPDFMQERIRLEGAEVVPGGKAWDEAHQAAMKEVEAKGAFYVHPFDHPTIWLGHSTMVDELKKQVDKPALVVVAVGGGGLLCGVLEGMHRNGWADVPVLACETEGTASFAATLKEKRLVTLPAVSGVAVTLGARTPTPKVLDWIGCHPISSFVCSDRQAVEACASFLDEHKFLVEPACGAALAAVYTQKAQPKKPGPVIVIVCGGVLATREKLQEWIRSLQV